MGSVIVVGGGVSGLACAHRLLELDPAREVIVLEAADHAGGLVSTELTDDGYVIERGPDAIITDKPWALALAKRLGLEGELVGTVPENRGAYVVARGRLEVVPEGFSMMAPVRVSAFLRSPILSWRGKLRAGLDLVLPRGGGGDESLASFVSRRFGRELLERLAQPLVSGIYGADPEMLSLRATMPRFLDLERDRRSIVLGLRARMRRASGEAASGARYGLFVNFRKGSQALVHALVERLGDRVRLRSAVTGVERTAAGYRVTTDGEHLEAGAVVLAVPAHRGAALVRPWDGELAARLEEIPYGSAATATFAWRRDQIPHPLDAYGFVVPSIEQRSIVAATWASRKWPGRAPAGMELIRVFFGGPEGEPLIARGEEALVAAARRELMELMGIHAEPALTRVGRHARAMPQYHLGHLDRVARIEERAAAHPGLHLAGNAYEGVGIPDTVHRGEQIAETLASG